ncbi:MAG: DUF1552 domain-containing protein [Pirellulaceae bacterium]
MSRANTHRRSFLKATGISIALPAFESRRRSNANERNDGPPKRLVCIGNEFGMYPGAFWPDSDGANYKLSPLLEPLAQHRSDMTLFSNLDHGQKGGHFAVHTFLTGVKATEARVLPDGGISLDQRAAEHVGSQTRFPSLTVGSEDGLHGGCRISWTRTGTRVPPITGPRDLFRQLFIDGDAKEKQQATDQIALQKSILDSVLGDAKSLSRRISKDDQRKLDDYLASVRQVESKLKLDEHWQTIPKPKPVGRLPDDEGLAPDLPKLYDLIAIALQTDSTRVATLEVGGSFAASDLGIRQGYHGLSHHGQVQANIDQLVQIELYQVQQFARFLETLKSIAQSGSDQSLLDSTMALFGSGMGNANSHTNNNLPIILAGGGFKHGTHQRFPEEANRRVPLCNLFTTMLQQFGVETDSFSNGTGTLDWA